MTVTFRLCILLLWFILGTNYSQAQQSPFNKGINLSNWFQASSAQAVQINKYSKQDFENIKSLGCDVVRLPINLHGMTDGAPDYNLDPLFLLLLNEVIDWAEELEMHLIIDNHTFSTGPDTSPEVGEVLKKVWRQMAEHFENRSDFIHYEMLNEPHGIDAEIWNGIVAEVIAEIREVDTKHNIIIGGVNWNSAYALMALDDFNDDKLIYTFHFYDPFLFTHQGASWVGPAMEEIAEVPFPYDENLMPAMPAGFTGTWLENSYNDYPNAGTVAAIQSNLDMVANFMQERNVPVYCGEFGVYQPNSNEADRVFWYEEVRSYLEQLGISWSMWDYHGGFGIFNEDGYGLFNHDLNVALGEALGFNVPAQTPFSILPDSVGFIVYDDFVAPGITVHNWHSGSANFFSTEAPNYGDYCLSWTGAELYQSITLDFIPVRDFSQLMEENYFLDFFVRTNGPWQNAHFDIRFMDTKTDDPEDHPWRMRMVVSSELGEDGTWKRVRLPLKDFNEHGSWDNNQWHEPEGKFDWTAIDHLAIVTEHTPLDSATLWIDHIAITNVDTVSINNDSSFVATVNDWQEFSGINLSPNPTSDIVNISADNFSKYKVAVYTIQGKLVDKFILRGSNDRDFSHLPKGIYLLHFKEKERTLGTLKLVKSQ